MSPPKIQIVHFYEFFKPNYSLNFSVKSVRKIWQKIKKNIAKIKKNIAKIKKNIAKIKKNMAKNKEKSEM